MTRQAPAVLFAARRRKSAGNRSVAHFGRFVVALRGDEGSSGSARTGFEGPVRRAEPSGRAGLRVLRPVEG